MAASQVTALLRVAPSSVKTTGGLAGDLESIMSAVKSVSWTALEELKGNNEILKKLDD